jgi:hypothetical protein
VGQKTHPKGFRLITTQSHLSKWYSPKATYPALIDFNTDMSNDLLFTFFGSSPILMGTLCNYYPCASMR